MTHTLLLRLVGPMQSWGVSSRFSERDTLLEPSKSGVVGILAAAQGWDRDHDLTKLARLTMGVRVDKEGVLAYDFHSAGAGEGQRGIIRAQGSGFNTSISRRFFLQDAAFLVGLAGDDLALLHELDAALRAPKHPIGLGRRSHVPSCPVALPGGGVRENVDLMDALEQEPWPVAELARWQHQRLRDQRCRLVLEHPDGAIVRPDQPVGDAFGTRVFGPRNVRMASIHPETRKEPDHARDT